ncbi:hypothetical protein ACJX0J_024872, partial [Zea mays]
MRPKKIALPLILTLSPLILILAAEASERNGVGAGERPSSHAGSRAQARGRPSERSTKRSNQHRQQHGNTVQASNRPRTGTFLRTTQSKNRLVAEGIRTSTGFKKVHLNMCAKALNDYFKMNLTVEQVQNHLRTWKRRYAKINRLRKLSVASWNEDNYMLTLDHEHYANYVQ